MSRKLEKQKAKVYPKKFIPPKKEKSRKSPGDKDKINNIFKLSNIDKNEDKNYSKNERSWI